VAWIARAGTPAGGDVRPLDDATTKATSKKSGTALTIRT
jgi:hypothetical protein